MFKILSRSITLRYLQVRVLLVSKRVTSEGEVLPVYQHELLLGESSDDGDHEERLFLVWPVIVQHCITQSSPLWDINADDLTSGHKHFEIIVILEGIVESTGMTTQVRASLISVQSRNLTYLLPEYFLSKCRWRERAASAPGRTRWRFGAVGSDVGRINEVTLRRARLVLGWVTVSGFNSRCGKFISC